jgi:hypothetical protein
MLRTICHFLAALVANAKEFKREWRRYSGKSSNHAPIEGRWRGEWLSYQNGHHGKLECVLEPGNGGDLTAFFHATYWKFLRVSYHTIFHTQPAEDRVLLQGKEDLGSLAGGIYTYEGVISDSVFDCTYACKYDHGRFHLQKLN